MRTLSSLARCFSVALAALAFCCSPALATDYYVDLGAGNDAGAGTIGDPWRTLTHAMATVPISQGHRVLLRGVANTSSPGEAFPIRVGAGISLGTWDAQQGATLDAGNATCLEIVGPAHRGQSVRGFARNLELRGQPAIFVPVLGAFESVDLQVEDCRLVGGFHFDVASLPFGVQRLGTSVTALRGCDVVGDVTYRNRSSHYTFSPNVLSPSLFDNEIQGGVLLYRLVSPSLPLEIRGNRVAGGFLVDGAGAQSITVRDNVISGGSLDLGASAGIRGNPILVQDNQVSGDLHVYGSGPLQVLRNRVGGDLEADDYDLSAVNENVVGGLLTFSMYHTTAAPCEALRNDAQAMHVESVGLELLTIAENTLRSTLELESLPHAAVEIRANRVTCGAGEHGILILAYPRFYPPYGSTLVTLRENQVTASAPGGSGIRVRFLQGQRFDCLENRVEGFDTGLAIEGTAVMGGTPSGTGFRIERNHFRGNAVGLDLDLTSSQEDWRCIANVVEGGTRGLVLNRGAYAGTIRMWNNVFAFHSAADVTATFAAVDRVQWNLAADGSLLARDLTNISGDPHFVDRSSGDVSLLPSSPAVGSGVDPLTHELGFNMGLDALAPAETLSFRTPSPSTGSLRFAQPSATAALMLFALAPAYPASFALCEGRLGLDASTWVATLPVVLQGGAATIGFALPPGPWTVAVQALSDGGAGVPPCRLSNTVIARR